MDQGRSAGVLSVDVLGIINSQGHPIRANCLTSKLTALQVLAVWSALGVDLHGSDPTVGSFLFGAILMHPCAGDPFS